MTVLDQAIIAGYFAVIARVGFSGGQKALKEYPLGGQDVPWWAAAG